MPIYVGGYYMTFATTRRLMAKLQIDDRGASDDYLERPINNWLAGHQEVGHILAGAIGHPVTGQPNEEDGILFMLQFVEVQRQQVPGGEVPRGEEPILQERKRDLRMKAWLMEAGGVEENELEWISLRDLYNLTINGIYPQYDDFTGPGTVYTIVDITPKNIDK
ncbi:hypothetical protein M413DRAFT_14247 [Hebeloma cylindrosporum]|uniref:Uncharacterized protein n=1 Tax=Hebeloma cylindrosporum TaxID=76867 RepID=A0A0C3BWZ9_HEBCY|nr:hypothetical protein M413DRAFT_14247 [Hebeloma cylindrosporum h7]